MNTGNDDPTTAERLERDHEDGSTGVGTAGASDRYEETTIGVVVPAYNEAEHVGAVLDSIPSFVDRIYAVDDASQDDTWSEIRDRALDGDERIADGGEASETSRTSLELRSNGGETSVASRASSGRSFGGGETSVTSRASSGRPPEASGVSTTGRLSSGRGSDSGEVRDASRTSSNRRFEDGPVDPRIVPIRHAENQGAGAALRTGYQRALADGVEVTVAMDADGQMDPDRMTALLDPVVDGPADYAKGNRLSDPAYRRAMPPLRQFGNWLLTLLTRVASGYWRTVDPQNGYTAISKEALGAIDLDALPDGHDYTNDLLVRLNVAGLRVADVSMPAVYGEEESSITYSQFVPSTSATLLRSFLWRLRRHYLGPAPHPLALFYGAGTTSVAAGLVLGVDALRHRRGSADSAADTDDAADDANAGRLALLSVLVGCLFVVRAMVLDRRENEDREVTWE